jgi:hypothetical protein
MGLYTGNPCAQLILRFPQPHNAPIPKPTITINSIPPRPHRRSLSRDSDLYIHPFSTFIIEYPFPPQVVVAVLLDKFFQAIAIPLKSGGRLQWLKGLFAGVRC